MVVRSNRIAPTNFLYTDFIFAIFPPIYLPRMAGQEGNLVELDGCSPAIGWLAPERN